MLYPFYGLERVCEFFNLRSEPFYGYYLKAIVVVQVHMLRRNDYRSVVVLYIQQLIYNLALMVVVNNRYGTGNCATFGEHIRHELLTDKVGDGLGPVRIAFRTNKGVELP